MKKMLFIVLLLLPFGAKAQRSIEFTWKKEQEHRASQHYTEEKHYKNGKLHGVYKKLDAKGKVVTKGCYVKGKRHGKWWELMTMYMAYHYIEYTYKHGTVTEIFEYSAWDKSKDSPKCTEDHYILQPDSRNYTVHQIYWNGKIIGKKNEETLGVVRAGITINEKRKVWDKGIPWKQQWTILKYDQNGKSLGHKRHGHWKLWNEDGTLQKETWYDMGKMLRQKLYEHGKLVSDKKYD